MNVAAVATDATSAATPAAAPAAAAAAYVFAGVFFREVQNGGGRGRKFSFKTKC